MLTVPKYIEELIPYQPGKPIEEVKIEYGLEKIVKLASNENPLGVSPKAARAMLDAIDQINRYPDMIGKLLRQCLSDFFNVGFDNVVTGNGAEGIISVILRTFLQKDDEVITSNGSFVGFYVMVKALGIKLNLIPLKGYSFDLERMAESINPNTKIIYLVNPNNPTGKIFTKSEFVTFMNKIPENILVILDEAYFEYVKGNSDYPDSLDYRYDNVISIRSFSKAYGMAGIRLGYGFGNKYFINNILKVRLPFEPGLPAQLAGIEALKDTGFLDKTIEINRDGKEYIYQTYDEIGFNYVNLEANFVMSMHESEEFVNKIYSLLLRNGVVIRPLRPFGLPHCLRVTTGLPEETELFIKTLKRIL